MDTYNSQAQVTQVLMQNSPIVTCKYMSQMGLYFYYPMAMHEGPAMHEGEGPAASNSQEASNA